MNVKKGYVHLLALALMLSILATPSYANGTASTNTFNVTMQDFPDQISPGKDLTGSFTVTMNSEGRDARQTVTYEFYVDSPLGDARVQSGSFIIRSGEPYTVKIDQPVADTVPYGIYEMKLVVTIGASSTSIGHTIDVVK